MVLHDQEHSLSQSSASRSGATDSPTYANLDMLKGNDGGFDDEFFMSPILMELVF